MPVSALSMLSTGVTAMCRCNFCIDIYGTFATCKRITVRTTPQVGFILAVAKFVYPSLPVAGVAPIPFKSYDVFLRGATSKHLCLSRLDSPLHLPENLATYIVRA